MQTARPGALFKPTLRTRFHIDYDWWEEHESSDLRPYILTHLPPEKRDYFIENEENRVIDFVDMETGEIQRLDELGQAIQEAAKDPEFFNQQTSLVDCIFRVFISNNNKPLTPTELAEITGRDARTILKTFGGVRVYKGIRPIPTN